MVIGLSTIVYGRKPESESETEVEEPEVGEF
jgi:hypothetical protein